MSNSTSEQHTGAKVYFSIYFTIAGLLIAAIVFGLVKLWGFLKEYESSQQYHVTDAILAELNSGDYTKLVNGADAEISEYETEQMLYEQIASRYTGEFTCTKSGKYSTDDNPAYMIKCGGENTAVLYLKKDSVTSEYGLDIFGFDKITGVTVQKNEIAKVTVPSNCSFTINGFSPEGELYLEERFSQASQFGEYLNGQPTMRTYSFGGLMFQPEIKVFDKNGRQIPVKLENKVYSAELPTTDTTAAAQAEEFAFEYATKYNEYISDDISFSDITPYIIKGTDLYTTLRTLETQFYGYHTGYEFRNKEIVSTVQYSDACFSVDLKYQHVLLRWGNEIVYDVSYTIFVTKTDDGWKALQLIIN